MKNFKQSTLLFAIVLVTGIVSCTKEFNDKEHIPDNYKGYFNRCLLTQLVDSFNYLSLDIFYNNRKQIDSVKLNSWYNGAFPTIIAAYDNIGRLKTIHFAGVQDYEALSYKGLVTTVSYYVPNYKDYGMTDSLNETITYTYNFKGELLQIAPVNIWYPGYDYTLNYTYDKDGNATGVTNVPESGTPFLLYTATSYDDKPNFLGNTWLNYLLFQTNFAPDFYFVSSRNNPVNYTQFFGSASFIQTNTYKYDHEGFANYVFIHCVDGQGNLVGDFTQTASSTCDNNPYPTTQANLPTQRPVLPQINRNMPAGKLMNKYDVVNNVKRNPK